ncbi:MAG: DUF1846 domain-containing protein [Clostridia bacterium]|nr:DUF1846 domain-containing protein [Clostridia bacterium]MBQ9481662.1 DUF1846 domain-containing protein [Clostridia bacterium]
MAVGFDNSLYVKKQAESILQRIEKFNNKLYLEFGGKIFDDLHAARVLPGFDPNVKTKLLLSMKDKVEIIFCISAKAIEQNKRRADFGITYDADLIRLVDNLRGIGLYVGSVVITQYSGQRAAELFKNKLERRGERVYMHTLTKGYPNDVDIIVSDEGYGAQPYIETTRPLVVVTAPGPGSGKLATCLSQLYHEYKRGVKAGYAKYESFPVWNMPLNHPVNVAYEAATVDLQDFNMIDPHHFAAYGVNTVNYNRDVAVFPVVKNILHKILGEDIYQSPTDMGVNMIGFAVRDDEVVRAAAKQEIIRRHYQTLCDYKLGRVSAETLNRSEILMNNLGLKKEDRKVVIPALKKQEQRGVPACAIELPDGSIVRGRNTPAMKATAAVVINAMKKYCGIKQDLNLISPIVIEPIIKMKASLNAKETSLTLDEALLALAVSTPMNTTIADLMSKLPILKECEAHSTVMLEESELQAFRRLGIRITCEPEYAARE